MISVPKHSEDFLGKYIWVLMYCTREFRDVARNFIGGRVGWRDGNRAHKIVFSGSRYQS